MSDLPPAGWYPAPGEPGTERRWSGAEWTDERREAAVTLRPSGVPQAGLREGQVVLLVFGAIFVLLVLVGLIYPLTVFHSG